jgi:hypothetical protein
MQESVEKNVIKIIAFIVIIIFSRYTIAYSQSSLSNLVVVSQNGKNQISWTHTYPHVYKIGVQRSQDSLFNYATIGYVRNPEAKANTFIDKKPFRGGQYYKLIIILGSGRYFFSKPVKIVTDSSGVAIKNVTNKALPAGAKSLTVSVTSAPVKKAVEVYKPSYFVYTNADGDVNVNLPNAAKNNYSLSFFDSTGVKLFSIDDIRKNFLVIDKSNFLHAGWFNYELYDGAKLKEKWRLYIPDQLKKKDPPKRHYRRRRR